MTIADLLVLVQTLIAVFIGGSIILLLLGNK
jgi:hypothetical protein